VRFHLRAKRFGGHVGAAGPVNRFCGPADHPPSDALPATPRVASLAMVAAVRVPYPRNVPMR
jgi:hypothetical protein